MKLTAVAALSLLLVGCRAEDAPRDEPVRIVRAMKVADLAGLTGRSFPGQASATQEVDLAFRVSGPMIALPVLIGDQVEEGELVARIDPRDFKVRLRNAQAQLGQAKATYALAADQHERGQAAFEQGGLNPIELTRLREAENSAKASVDAMEAAVDAARDAVTDTDLLAPFSGIIVAHYVDNFENVRADQRIVRLLDKTRIEFIVNIPESLISLVRYVEDIRVRYDAFPDLEVPAKILEVGAEASATTRTFPVTLIMDQPEGALILPGMAGRVFGTARAPDEARLDIVIPVTAVFSPAAEDGSCVWVIDPSSNTVARREVRIGQLVSGGYVVQSGLETGELIATAGVHFLKEGQEVAPELQ
jgi:RND family efflux transporter MFP subunit